MTVIEPEADVITVEQSDERPVTARSARVREALTGLAFLVPAGIVFAVFSFYPLYRLVWLSLHQQNNTGTAERPKYDQLGQVLTSDLFTGALRTTLAFLVYTIPLGLILGTVLAVVVHRRLKGIRIYQTIFSSTVATSTAVASVIFFVLINPAVGYFSNVKAFSLADPATALRGVALSSIWQNLGLTFIIVLAGLQAVPEELNEAATLDGFGPFRRFFKVTIPLISPTLLFLVVVLAIFGMQAYAQIDILTSGGPNHATETLVWRIFNNSSPSTVGVGAALSLGLFGVTLLITIAQFTILERRVHYGR